MTESRSVLFVVNPASGGGRGVRIAQAVQDALVRRGYEVHTELTRIDSDVYAEVDPGPHRALVVFGGDGSIHAAVNGLDRFDTPIAFVGTGTVNVLARECDLPFEAERIADSIAEGRTLRIPLLETGGRRWILFTESGYQGRLVGLVNRLRAKLDRHGKAEFGLGALCVIPFAWGRPVVVEVEREDGSSETIRCANALFTRARLYGGNMPMPIPADLERPLASEAFQVVADTARTPLGHLLLLTLGVMRLLPRWTRGLERIGLVRVVRARSARVVAPRDVRTHLDAETFPPEVLALDPPIETRPVERSFELLLPATRAVP